MDAATIEFQALQAIPFFAGLSEQDLQGVIAIGKPVSFGPQQTIVSRGDAGDAMYVIVRGTATVDVGGRQHELKQGDFFGEMALIASRKRIATVRSAAPVLALRIDADVFNTFLMSHPSVAVGMLRATVDRLREVEERVDAWIGTG
jgi:CRP-like cAMP-binding protein